MHLNWNRRSATLPQSVHAVASLKDWEMPSNKSDAPLL
jgi:hypothetical protein